MAEFDADDLNAALDEYRDKFDATVTTMGIPNAILADAPAVLRQAIEDDERLSDAEFMRKLGLEPSPDDADI